MPKTKIGRPRSEKAREAILDAAHALLSEAGGGGLTIEAIARRAGAGKPTLYRWWPSMADIVLESLLYRADTSIPVVSGKPLGETLRLFLRQSMEAISEGNGIHLRYLMAQAQQDDGFRERFRDGFVSRRREAFGGILRQAAERGEISPAHDAELVVDVVFGAMWYRLLVGHAPMDASLADDLTRVALGMLDTNPS